MTQFLSSGAIVGLCLTTTGLLAQIPGTLDLSFDGDGHRLVDVAYRTSPWEPMPVQVLVQPTGKLFYLTASDTGALVSFYKFLPDGSPDVSFAGTGQRHMHFFSQGRTNGLEAQLQPDGKILMLADGPLPYTTLVRALTHNGDLDTTFAGDGTLDSLGVVETHLRSNQMNYSIRGFLCMSDGRTLAWGTYNGTALLVRLLADGTPDPTFGTAGMVREDLHPNGYFSFEDYSCAAILADGSIIASGAYGDFDDNFISYNFHRMVQARYTVDGSLISRQNPAPHGTHSQILPTPDGGFIARQYGKIIKVQATGTLDSAFAGSGSINVNTVQILLQPDGRILGIEHVPGAGGSGDVDAKLHCWLSNGMPDTAFGTGGFAQYAPTLRKENFKDMVLQPDGKILVGGISEMVTLGRYQPFALRYHSSLPVGNDLPSFDGDLVLYPNPSEDGSFSLQSPTPLLELTCWDALGRAVPLQPNGQDGGYQMPQAVAAGVYLLRVEVQGQVHVLRLLRQ